MCGRGIGRSQTYIDPRKAFDGQVSAEMNREENSIIELDPNRYQSIEFKRDTVSYEEYRQILDLSSKYYPGHTYSERSERTVTIIKPPFINISLQETKKYGERDRDILSRAFNPLEAICSDRRYTGSEAVQILKGSSEDLVQVLENQWNSRIEKIVDPNTTESRVAGSIRETIRSELSGLKRLETIEHMFMRSSILEPGSKLYDSFMDFFIEHIHLQERQKFQFEKRYLAPAQINMAEQKRAKHIDVFLQDLFIYYSDRN